MTAAAEACHFVDVLDRHARRLGGRDAVLFLADGRRVSASRSFAALRRDALEIAGGLRRRYPAQARVLIMLPTSLDYVGAFLGCLYGGLVAVPLFPPVSRPRHLERIHRIIADAAPAAILCEAPARPVLQTLLSERNIAADVLAVDQLRDAGAPETPDLGGDTLAFLQYTSGSTVAPKGVMVQHRQLLANCRLMQRARGFAEDDCMVSWLPLYHDMGLIGGLLTALYCAMPCYLMASQTFARTPAVWLEALSRHRGSVSFAPNFAYALCSRAVDDDVIDRLDLRRWRHAVNGAEPVHPATLDEFCRRFARAGFRPDAFSPGYGQAEATLCVSIAPPGQPPLRLAVDTRALAAGQVRPAGDGAPATVLAACGCPQPGHDVAVVDPRTGQRCAADEVGELWLRGPSNAAGYWRNETATAAAFRARLDDDSDYLRSGDLGFLHQGQVVICARLHDLIILNGRNVYPQDVEFAIADAEPAIRPGRLAAFAAADAQQGREALVVVAEPRRQYLDPKHHPGLFARMRQAVQAALDCTLERIVLVRPGSIPMTTSGKISRQGARRQWLAGTLAVVGGTADPEPVAVSLDTAAVRRRIAAGEPAAAAWMHWLRGQIRRLAPGVTVAPEDSLIACGLDSVTLLALHGVLEAELGWQDGPGTLFGDCSVQTLAAALARHKPPAAPEAPPMPRDQARQSYAQRRLWFLHQLAPDSPRHNIVVTLSLQGPLEADALERALLDICRRHGPLRTLYADRPDGPMQIVLPQPLFALVRHDLDGTPPEAQGRHRQQFADGEGRRPFALERGEALRAHLLRYGPREHDLLLCLHHIAFDGRSAEILLEELSAGYAAARRGETPPRVAPAQSYADFAEWEAARLDKGRIQQALDFWRDYLDGVPQTLNLPREPGGAAGAHRFPISHDTCAALARLSQAQGQTLFMTLLGLFGVLLHYLSRQDRFLVGTDVSGRSHPQWQGLIGFFVNQLPLRCDLAGAPTLSAIMARVRRDAQAAYAHQDLPFDLLVSALAPQRAHDRTPLFQVKLNYQRDRSQGLALDDVRLGGVRVDQQPGGFALVLDLVHGSQGIAACLKYDAACFGVFQMHRFASLWQRLLGDAEGLLPLNLDQIRARLAAWDDDLQRQQQRRCTAADRSRLGQIRRRPLHELPGDSP